MSEFGGLWKDRHTSHAPWRQNNQLDDCGCLLSEQESHIQSEKHCHISSSSSWNFCVSYFWQLFRWSNKLFSLKTKDCFNVKKKKNLKQSWLPAFWKKIQNAQEIKRTLFNKTEQDKKSLMKKRSFNLLCVLDIFSECWQPTLFQIFFFFF